MVYNYPFFGLPNYLNYTNNSSVINENRFTTNKNEFSSNNSFTINKANFAANKTNSRNTHANKLLSRNIPYRKPNDSSFNTIQQNIPNFDNFFPKNSIKSVPKSCSENPFFSIAGISLYFDDILLIFVILFLYSEKVDDYYLLLVLILLLIG